ncbi:MAG: tRNA (N6-isopentenyl adenosine(37)-C2)-methylthiotransferase MiaB [Candidatus Omnitrophota bacterium]
MPKVYIKTFGCQMNFRDSEALMGLFLEKGYVIVNSAEKADVILVNTCSVRGHAEDRALSFLGSLKKISLEPVACSLQCKVVGLIGCMARNRGEEVFKKMPHVNLICGPSCVDRVPEYIDKIKKEKVRIIDLEDRLRNEDFYRAPFRVEPDSAQVVISTGCSNYCSYCIVPYVRGELRLREPADIIDEVKRNVDLGIRKITLLGQNVNDYNYVINPKSEKRKTIDFIDLLREVDKIDRVEEVGFVTSHPRNTSIELFELMAKSQKIKKQLHLPFQSGSNRILKMMNRGYTREKYLQLADDYKKITKGVLGADVIVGFPGETEEDFLRTKDILEKVKFNYAYIFKYSPRPHTKALELEDDVSQKEKERRHKILLDLQKRISAICKRER